MLVKRTNLMPYKIHTFLTSYSIFKRKKSIDNIYLYNIQSLYIQQHYTVDTVYILPAIEIFSLT